MHTRAIFQNPRLHKELAFPSTGDNMIYIMTAVQTHYVRYLILFRPSCSDSNVCASDFHIQCILAKVSDLKTEIIILSRVNFWRITRKQILGFFLGGAQASENRGGAQKVTRLTRKTV